MHVTKGAAWPSDLRAQTCWGEGRSCSSGPLCGGQRRGPVPDLRGGGLAPVPPDTEVRRGRWKGHGPWPESDTQLSGGSKSNKELLSPPRLGCC